MLAKKTAKRIPMVNIPIVNIPMIQVNYGIASSYDNCIEIHHKLPADLKERILNHEKKHGKGAYNIQDFKNDFQSNNSYFFKSLKFAFFNLEALIGFFPFMYSYYLKTFTWNSSAVYPFFWFGLIFSLFFFFILKSNFFISFLFYAIFVFAINLILLIYTHNKVKKDKEFIYVVEN